uniref:EAL domain-containing protein n=1 Tax=Caballeronia sp. INML3 TaxID=2921752 RepID=UPI002032A564
EQATRRGELEMELRRAIVDGQLFVVYQPVVSLQATSDHAGLSPHAAGVEALVRWRHPRKGVVPPGEFIEIAEETGVINDLGRFVLL